MLASHVRSQRRILILISILAHTSMKRRRDMRQHGIARQWDELLVGGNGEKLWKTCKITSPTVSTLRIHTTIQRNDSLTETKLTKGANLKTDNMLVECFSELLSLRHECSGMTRLFRGYRI